MTDKPRKTLSITRKPAATANLPASTESGLQGIRRSPKRIIRRDELPTTALTKPKAPIKPKPKARKKAPPKKPLISPSDIRLDNLNASLNGLPVWRDRVPLSLGVEREIFQFIADRHLSASKRVVQRLLRQHTRRRDYLLSVGSGGVRFHLDGSEAGQILPAEREHAGRVLAGSQNTD